MADISPITDRLYVASRLNIDHLDEVRKHGIRLVISMIGRGRDSLKSEKGALDILFLKTYDTFFTPIPMRVLKKGVLAALPFLERSEKVLVYCKQGKRRSVTLAAALLIAQGRSGEEAIELLLKKRPVSSPMLGYVKRRIHKFERFWKKDREKQKRYD